MAEPLEGTVDAPCPATAARCVCAKPAGHVVAGDDVHACDPAECSGSWRGMTLEAPDFQVVSYPSGVPGRPDLLPRLDGALVVPPMPRGARYVTYQEVARGRTPPR